VTILLLTAEEDPEERAKEIGAAEWVGKPFNIATLLRRLAAVLR